jgi:MarR family transcriptional regulator, lower aerobic nicotinate degradation pathway regulator
MSSSRAVHPRVTEVLDAMRRIIRDLRQSSRTSERRFGIGSAQLFVLQQLAEGPAGSINELAERTYTHQSSVSVVVRRLVEQGLVVRRPAMDDRRRRELRLTPAGRRVVARAPVPAQVRLIHALLQLPATQLSSFERLLKRVVKEMGASGAAPEMLFADDGVGPGYSAPRSRGRRQWSQKTSRGKRKTRPARPRR